MRTRKLRQLLETYRGCAPGELGERLRARLAEEPHCAVSRYLWACQCFDRGRLGEGVRDFMVAHHLEPQLRSAALLALAGLCWVVRREEPLLPVLLDAWEEFRRPSFDRLPLERLVLDAFAEPAPEHGRLAPLARRLWRLPVQGLRAQLRQALAATEPGRFPLLLRPA